ALGAGGLLPVLNKKLIANSLNILFDLLAKLKNRAILQEVSAFLMLAVYRMFRIVYSVDPKNARALFSAPEAIADGYAAAAMQRCATNATVIAGGSVDKLPQLGELGEVLPLSLTTQTLSTNYPLFAASLFNLVRNAEEHMALGKHE
ncbi:MAG: transcriptional regulator, partial [Oscillospiraceae bacterium]